MEAVLPQEVEAQAPGAELLRSYFLRQGDSVRAQQWQERFFANARILALAQQERARLRLTDRIAPHHLSAEVLARLVEQLKAVPNVRRAYFVRKLNEHWPEKPSYVFGVESAPRWALASQKRSKAVLESIRTQVVFPSPTIILNLEGLSPRFAIKLRRVEGATIVPPTGTRAMPW